MTDTHATTDNRRARSEATQAALMRAGERLIAERGMENVSIRDIVTAAGQKNESALQYHFKNFSGLINAIHLQRADETQRLRGSLLDGLLARGSQPSLRQICMLMVQPAFELAQRSAGFRRYVKAFGHELVLTEDSPLLKVSSHGRSGVSGRQIRHLLEEALPHLDEATFIRRLEAAVRLCAASMYHQARQKNAFRGSQAELFLHNLVDALVGLLSAEVSDQTRALNRRTGHP